MGTDFDELFLSFRTEIESDQELREEIRVVVRDLEQKTRDISTVIQKIHHTDGVKRIPEICAKAKEEFVSVQSFYAKLAKLIPVNEYFRYCDHYRYTNQRLAFLAAFVYFLETDSMISRQDVAKVLGIHTQRSDGFHLDLEDYLFGLLNLASELARFSVNCVSCGDYARPFKIANFVNDLDSGFRLLNLKNDNLRKRFDSLKYDVKKVEEVVYDLTIRGLKPQITEGTN